MTYLKATEFNFKTSHEADQRLDWVSFFLPPIAISGYVNNHGANSFQWFYDVRQSGVLDLAGSVATTAGIHDITSGSALVPLHDQDAVGEQIN